MIKKFDIRFAIEKWCADSGHDGVFCGAHHGDPCGCKADDLAPCGELDNITDGACVGGKLTTKPFIDANGNECSWAIVPHDNKPKVGDD